MRHYIIKIDGHKVAPVEDLSFLSQRHHRYNWLQRHYYNIRYKRACRKADYVIVNNDDVANDVVKYYFIPRSKIVIRRSRDKRH